ncbi:SDR family NAD(P)-dependent oxidoreductase [Microbispora sp. ATCC PTA-5024]|uniref:SDR family NAD(P)-dependent oxidoreductase n=1 Tax=Microbispora sp. ATCC PTA-5024 TaxID=316330 RepID=UPI0003DDD3B5|nr:SDR family NAD(P)-dependent oxidoreductase [Microbispora sp. ATCC PTA-5024]ETK36975.1 3-ketoacyl-ACP reductase [Microbispora sp. ATCC PTA-5024]
MSGHTGLDGRAAIVTGAGGGIGRAEALALAASGAGVVVNDVGPAAGEVAAEIGKLGGTAVAVTGDVGDWTTGDLLVRAAVDTFGRLDVVVNNAGVLRDRMVFNLGEDDWDTVVRVHLKGHAALSRAATAYWRGASKAAGGPVYGRIVNTSSEAFLFGSPGQPNYAAAKAGIVALTLATAQSTAKYGVTANAICPRARTAMTARVFGESPASGGSPGSTGGTEGSSGGSSGGLDALAPERVATFVSYLASPASARITGQVFVVYADLVALMAAPAVERTFRAEGGAFDVAEIDALLTPYFGGRDPRRGYAAHAVAALDTTGVPNAALDVTGVPGAALDVTGVPGAAQDG